MLSSWEDSVAIIKTYSMNEFPFSYIPLAYFGLLARDSGRLIIKIPLIYSDMQSQFLIFKKQWKIWGFKQSYSSIKFQNNLPKSNLS